jgi:hypothetical protein
MKRRKIIAALVLATMSPLMFVAPASAHNAGPCNESGEPGNSDFAQHHIVPVAQAGGLGAGGHIPGAHQGYSTCV